MSKSSLKRAKKRANELSRIIGTSPDLFEYKWEMRLSSWLNEIQLLAKEWKNGGAVSKDRIFGILDTAMNTLAECGPEAYAKYAPDTYNLLCGECCARVAGIMEPRLYRLSNTNRLPNLSRAEKHSRR